MSLQSRGVRCDGTGIMTALFDRWPPLRSQSCFARDDSRNFSLDGRGSRFKPSKHQPGCSTSLQRHFEALMKIYESDKRYEGDVEKQSFRRCASRCKIGTRYVCAERLDEVT